MRILELCEFSAGICGTFTRVKQEADMLSKIGHKVVIFSSDYIKGSPGRAKDYQLIGKIKIKRFHGLKLGGESFINWNFRKEALEFSPDVIIAHVYRHLHTLKALKIANLLKKKGVKCKVFLVTHAPFTKETRSFLARSSVQIYDKTIGKKMINKFDKLLYISRWEVPYLLKLGVKREKLVYSPNGIDDKYFSFAKRREQNKILFFGRVSPIKSLETAILALKQISNKNIILEIAGPAEKEYLSMLKRIIKKEGLEKRVVFTPAIFDLKRKIRKIDSAKIFILPSKREGMPIGLIEAMARGKIVLSSNNPGSKDIINDGKNGFLFNVDDSVEMTNKINHILNMSEKQKHIIKQNAKNSVEIFKWSALINSLDKLIMH